MMIPKCFWRVRRSARVSLGTRGPFGLFSVTLAPAQLHTHAYLVGASGSGKSKYLQHLLFHLTTSGWGCGVIDPHSDLANDLIAQLAAYPRHKPWLSESANRRRVVYLDPARTDVVVPVNLLKNSVATPYAVAENIVEAFKRVWPQTLAEAPRFAQILRNSILVLALRGLTLLELEPFLTHAEYRAKLLANFPDPHVASFFALQYARWGREQLIMASPVLNKVSAFLFQPAVRLSLGAAENRVDLRAIMDGRQLLVVDLGGLTGETQQLYGSLLVTSMEQAAMSRRDQPPEARQPFFCCIDEFPNFITRDAVTLARVLSEVRKQKVFMALAHQTMGQLGAGRIQGALENCRLRVAFQAGRQTAEVIARELFLANPQSVKHEVEDETAKERTHPVFDPLLEQMELFTQRIQRLRNRHMLVKLPDEEAVVELASPTVPPSLLSRQRLEQIKGMLARQQGRARPSGDEEGSQRTAGSGRRSPTHDDEALDWVAALWQKPAADGARRHVIFPR